MIYYSLKTGLLLSGIAIATAVSLSRVKAGNGLDNYMRDSLGHVVQKVELKILRARYMEEKPVTVKKDLIGWQGIPVTLFEYHVKDTKTGLIKTAKIYMANAPANRIARWVVTACWKAKNEIREKDIDKLINQIAGQSGGQFPVLGIVYEDMEGSGVQYPYLFKDGVTIYPRDFKPALDALSDEQINQCITLTDSLIKPNTGRYARICSTTREDYYQGSGTDSVGHSTADKRSVAWLHTVSKLYQQALTADNNELITMWAKVHL